MIWKLLSFSLIGYHTSRTVYPLTHTKKSGATKLPGLFGTVVGCTLVFFAFVSLKPKDDNSALRLVAAFTSVGLGVAVNRLRMMVEDK